METLSSTRAGLTLVGATVDTGTGPALRAGPGTQGSQVNASTTPLGNRQSGRP